MKIDKILRDIQLNLIKMANELQKQREDRLRTTATLKERKDKMLLSTTEKLSKVFEELGYDVR